MVDSAAACARGRARSSRSRTQGEAFGGAKGEPEDADPAQISRVIRARGVGESTIYNASISQAAVSAGPYVGSRKSACRIPSPRIPDSPRDAPSTVQVDSLPPGALRVALSPPDPRNSDSLIPDAVSSATPASPGTGIVSSGSRRSRTLRPGALQRATRPLSSFSNSAGCQPRRDASQPISSAP